MILKLRLCEEPVASNLTTSTSAPLSGDNSTQNMNGQQQDRDWRPVKRGRITGDNGCPKAFESNEYSWKPKSDPIWRGGFAIGEESSQIIARLEGHLITKASPAVCELARSLPSLLHLERLPLLHPERLPSFMPLPTYKNVHILFCPESRRDADLDNLMNVMLNERLAMKATDDGVKLFLFTSHQLKEEHRRFNGEYYLWAMLQQRLDSHLRHSDDHISTQTGEMPVGGAEGYGYHSPDQTSAYTFDASILNLPSAINESSSSDECDSADDGPYEQVGHYLVKPSVAPILRRIMERHGDIAGDCQLQSRRVLASALEEICVTVHKLVNISFINLRKDHMTSLETAISDGEELKLDVKWLRQRYNEIKKGVDLAKYYKKLGDMATDNAKATEVKRNSIMLKKEELEKLQQEVQSLENQVEVLEKEHSNLKNKATKVSSSFRKICHKFLMDGLF